MSPAPIIRGPRPVMRPVKPKPANPENQDAKKKEEPVKPAEQPKVTATPVPESQPVVTPAAETKTAETTTAQTNTVQTNTVQTNNVVPPKQESKAPAAKKEDPKKPAPKPQRPPKPKSESKTDGAKVFLLITNLLCLGVIGYLLYDKFESQKLVEIEKETASATYKTDLNNKLAEITRLQDSLKVVIAEKQALGLELADEKAKLQELDVLKAQLQNKQVSINALNKKLASFKKDYIMATSAMEALTASKTVVLQEKESLQAMLQAKDDSLKVIMGKVQELSEKVEIASSMKVQSVSVTPYNTAGRELKEAPSYKAMLIGKIRVAVNLEKNELAEGRKEIYMRIIEPGGAVLYEGDKSFMFNGKKTAFTDKQTIDAATQHNVQFHYVKGSRYRPGKYTVEVYGDGKRLAAEYIDLTK